MVAACRGRGGSTYRGGSTELRAAKGDGGVFLSRWPPVGQQRQEEFREGATVVVWLRGDGWRDKEDGRKEGDAKQGNTEKKNNSRPRDTEEESGNGIRGGFPLASLSSWSGSECSHRVVGLTQLVPPPWLLANSSVEPWRTVQEEVQFFLQHIKTENRVRMAPAETLRCEACLGNSKIPNRYMFILQCSFSTKPAYEKTTNQSKNIKEFVYF